MTVRPVPLVRGAGALAAVAAVLFLAACAPEGGTPTPTSSSPSPSSSASTSTPSPSPSVSTAASAQIPDDCRAMLTPNVLAQLGDTPLNDPATGVNGGVQADGSLVCLWRDARADTTFLETDITRMNRGPALDLLNQLADEQGFTCYTPDQGTRCEKTWQNEQYPVTDGRTLFWRDDILIDTTFSNLAPSGYTDSVVRSIFG